jgi:hypothetical protein
VANDLSIQKKLLSLIFVEIWPVGSNDKLRGYQVYGYSKNPRAAIQSGEAHNIPLKLCGRNLVPKARFLQAISDWKPASTSMIARTGVGSWLGAGE